MRNLDIGKFTICLGEQNPRDNAIDNTILSLRFFGLMRTSNSVFELS